MRASKILPDEFLNSLGILDWGYTEESKPKSFNAFESWIKKDLHGPLSYLSDHRQNLRSDLKEVFPEFQSAIVFLFSYKEAKKWMLENEKYEIASYALGFGGEDYHLALKMRLQKISDHLKSLYPQLETSISLDIQPILERDLAHRAGLGWFGKNSMLINQKHGSYFILGSLLLNQKLDLLSARVDVDHCGQCSACVSACPTEAIDPMTRTLSASKCISTFTIEIIKDAEAPEGFDKSRGEIFGCDICQDVCPWNKKPLQKVEAFLKLEERFLHLKELFYDLPKNELAKLINEESNRSWKKRLFGSALDRPGKQGWLKNLKSKK
jgi:epoxyqueuosine reductase